MIAALLRRSLAICALALPALSAHSAVEPEGSVVMAVGRATATATQGVVRNLSKGAPVYSGELMSTGANSYLNLRFSDGAFFLLRPETRFEVKEHITTASVKAPPLAASTQAPAPPPRVQPSSGSSGSVIASNNDGSRAWMTLLKGGFRTVSGLIGKVNRDAYRITTPVATIGVRGTRYSARLCQGECPDRDDLLQLLRDAGGDGSQSQTLLVTHVEEGAILITTGTESRVQEAVSTFITLSDGRIIPVAGLPRIEQEELDLPADRCGLVDLP